MKLIFQLRFHTKPGQSLWLTGDHEIFGSGRAERATPLRYLNPEFWQATVQLPAETVPADGITYHYLLRHADGSVVEDWDDKRITPASCRHEELLVIDSWNDAGFFENAFYTEPFKQVLLKANQAEVRGPSPATATHTFKVKAPLLAKGQTLCLLGGAAALGHWSTVNPRRLDRIDGEDFLTVELDLRGQSFPLAYKYGVYDVEKNGFVRYEDGDNRILYDAVAPGRHTMVNDGFVRLPANTWKGAGVAIPVFSLRSENSFGVGEFADLELLADWGSQAGLKLIQILPVNDTTATHTWTDSYPYAAISAFALHPIYLNLGRVATGRNKAWLKQLEPERQRLNALDALDYDAVMKAKLDFIKQIFPSEKVKTFKSREYRQFFADHRLWLVPYAVFCHLRDRFGTPDFNQWPAHRSYRAEEVAALVAEDSPMEDDIARHYFMQYHLHRQLQEVMAHAHERGIILKGDIAIGVYRHGADVWQQPELFHTDVQAGAPPDAFAVKGQNWGFPTYNWPRMKEDGFAWWKRRFAQMSCYYDAFRIDHILGFFRIWSIPAHAVEGILGYFVPAIPVDVAEFAARGIAFDRDRYTRLFITDAVLREIFGDESEAVHREFLQADENGRLALKPEFATQQQVEKHFAVREPDARNAKIKSGLFDLISNVILFEAEGSRGKQFHFRFAMEDTATFKALAPRTRAQLRELYVDYFFRRQEGFWLQEAAQKLPALKRVTNMLMCGEDLGLVPACVPELMKELGLLSLEIQRMPKQPGRELSRPADAPYLSVVSPSTHDMSTLRGWWEEDRGLTQKFFNVGLGRPGEAPRQCEPGIVQAIVRQHLAAPAMWSIFQLQDLLGMDGKLRRADPAAERINVPAIPVHYWRYRMHLTLEELQRAEMFNANLRDLIRQSGR
ncbi:MAG: 4-alpha-glucanotransferase [Limisphaerales bacterium]